VLRTLPDQRYLCFYSIRKRRGEQLNWYNLPVDERRALMRGHGKVGHKYSREVTQVIGGSIGLDDWEWGVSLHSEDPLAIKRLITEMRFDPASSLYAEFGPFLFGIRQQPDDLQMVLAGGLS
jgi:hydrogen peroxide-dependent heme synthase